MLRGGAFVIWTDSKTDLNRALMEEGRFEIAAFYFGKKQSFLCVPAAAQAWGGGSLHGGAFVYVCTSTPESLCAVGGIFGSGPKKIRERKEGVELAYPMPRVRAPWWNKQYCLQLWGSLAFLQT